MTENDASTKRGPELVLVVDDDDAILEALRDVLTDAGYAVTTAMNGFEALKHLEQTPAPDVAIVDLMMPEMDGWGFIAELRARPELRATPVVVITAGGAATLSRAPVAAAYLTKPLRIDSLLQVLQRTLTMRRDYRTTGTHRIPPAPNGRDDDDDAAASK